MLGGRGRGAAGSGTFSRVTRGLPRLGWLVACLPICRLFDFSTFRLVGKLAGQGGGARKVRACGCDELTTLRGLPC